MKKFLYNYFAEGSFVIEAETEQKAYEEYKRAKETLEINEMSITKVEDAGCFEI